MKKGFLIYEEMRKYLAIQYMRPLVIPYMNLQLLQNFLLYEENLIFFFISVWSLHPVEKCFSAPLGGRFTAEWVKDLMTTTLDFWECFVYFFQHVSDPNQDNTDVRDISTSPGRQAGGSGFCRKLRHGW
jgi:hypothetical protein